MHDDDPASAPEARSSKDKIEGGRHRHVGPEGESPCLFRFPSACRRRCLTGMSLLVHNVSVTTCQYIMRITFAYDKKARIPHYQVRHGDIQESQFEEVFSGPMVVIGRRGSALKAVGRTRTGRFLTVVFIRRGGDDYHVITAWPSKRTQIVLWHREMSNR